MRAFFRSLLADDSGATAVEYAVMLALILIAIIGSVQQFGAGNGGAFDTINNQIQAHF